MATQETETSLLDTSLHEITKEHGGETGLIDRLLDELETTLWDDESIHKVHAALALALDAHQEDMRGPHPYSTHFLRVAIRILSKDHFNIRDNPDLIIAALLHDTVEDHPEYFVHEDESSDPATQQKRALQVIGEMFGNNVQHLVAQVTNPPSDKSLPKAARNVLYRAHVGNILDSQPEAGIIKLSDFIDNCAGLKHNENPERAAKLAFKYLELVPSFVQFVERSDVLAEPVKSSLRVQLGRSRDRCLALL